MTHDELAYQAATEQLLHQLRMGKAIVRLAQTLKVELDPKSSPAEMLEVLADTAERYLTDAIIAERL